MASKGKLLYDWLTLRLERDRAGFIKWLESHVGEQNGECVLWKGKANPNGYCRFNVKINGKHTYFYVHHLIWTLANGRPLPDDREIDHECNEQRCMTHKHLPDVTRKVNLSRRDERQKRKNGGAAPDCPF